MTQSVHTAASEIPPAMDYAAHERQYRRFTHLLKWAIIHALIMLPALYFLVVAGQPVSGVLLMIVAVIAIGYGIISVPAIARDIGGALEHQPDRS